MNWNHSPTALLPLNAERGLIRCLLGASHTTVKSIIITYAQVGLLPQLDVLAGELSGGQRRKLSVALALLGDPSVVFLDVSHGRNVFVGVCCKFTDMCDAP